DDPQCRAFVYGKPGYQGPNARCWLKNGVPDQVQAECCVSGVKGETNVQTRAIIPEALQQTALAAPAQAASFFS
ncbi:MAG: PAN domain-containing protein, partial [Methanotrichaceae archaeon]|nr:PAN domain-containing protein [Methanotrichaceae archaeon]